MQKLEYSHKDTNYANAKDLRGDILDQFMEIVSNSNGVSLSTLMTDFEKAILMKALTQFNGNLRKTSIFLGVKYTTLHQKMKKYNIIIRKSPYVN